MTANAAVCQSQQYRTAPRTTPWLVLPFELNDWFRGSPRDAHADRRQGAIVWEPLPTRAAYTGRYRVVNAIRSNAALWLLCAPTKQVGRGTEGAAVRVYPAPPALHRAGSDREHFDSTARTACSGQSTITGHQHAAKRLCNGDVARVVGGHVRSQLVRATHQRTCGISSER